MSGRQYSYQWLCRVWAGGARVTDVRDRVRRLRLPERRFVRSVDTWFSPQADRAWSQVERAVALVAIFIVGVAQDLHNGVTSGYVVALLLLPLGLTVVGRYRGMRVFVAVGLLSAISGYLLSRYSAATNVVLTAFVNSSLALFVGIIMSVLLILWGRQILPASVIGLVYSAGMIAGIIVLHRPTQGNAWKFNYALPVSVFLLSLVIYFGRRGSRRTRLAEIVCLIVLALVSVFFDCRSHAATFVLAALLVAWQMRYRRAGARGSVAATIALLGGIALTLYELGTSLLVDGYLGADAQARTIAQIDTSGSLILGGRPEIQATLALFAHRPMGFGMGVIATPNEVLIAKSGLNSINYAPNNGYVEKFMFGNQIELHSVLGDMWAQAGLAGIAFVVVIGIITIHALASRITSHNASGVVLVLGIWTLWNLLFSPLYGSAQILILALGLIPLHRRPSALPVAEESRSEHSRVGKTRQLSGV